MNAYAAARKTLAEKHAEETARLERRFNILSQLPDFGNEPVICNFAAETPLQPSAWISYRQSYGNKRHADDVVSFLAKAEALRWHLIPSAALVKWDKYRFTIENCDLATARAIVHPSGYELKEGFEVAPYWITLSQYIAPEFVCYMRSPDGLTYRVAFELRELPALVYGQKTCPIGAAIDKWHYISATLKYPVKWKAHHFSKAYINSTQDISGTIYFPLENCFDKASDAVKFFTTN